MIKTGKNDPNRARLAQICPNKWTTIKMNINLNIQ